MKSAIIYGSRYGSARRYAEEFSERIGVPACAFDEGPDLRDCEVLAFFGGMYAGGVLGLKQTLRGLEGEMPRRLLIATVGLADPREAENEKNLRTAVERQVPKALLPRTEVFHLRGGVDYAKLSLAHRGMMRLVYEKARRMPEAERGAEDRAILETYGKAVDMVDFAALEDICAALRRA